MYRVRTLSALNQFVQPWQWLDPRWRFGGYVDEMSFQVGILVIACVLASAVALRWLDPERRRFVSLALALSGGALWIMTPAARPAYLLIQPLQAVQFPWRFLGPASLFLAAAGGAFVVPLVVARPRAGPWIAGGVALLALLASYDQRSVAGTLPLADDHAAIESAVLADTWAAQFGSVHEYLPKGAPLQAATTAPRERGLQGIGVAISAVRHGHQEVRFAAETATGVGVAVLPWHFFPGWHATLDGRPWETGPGPDGLISCWIPEGRHELRIWFGTTTPRIVGWLLAIAAIAALGALAWRQRARVPVR
jgi:hypothetical protein